MGRFKTSSGNVFDGLEKNLVHENLCDVEMWHLWQMWFVKEQDCNQAPRQALITQLPLSHRSHHCSRITGVTVTRACRVVTVTARGHHLHTQVRLRACGGCRSCQSSVFSR